MTHPSIEVRLPTFIGALLVAAVGGAYQEVKRSAMLVATERLDRVTKQLADLLQTSVSA